MEKGGKLEAHVELKSSTEKFFRMLSKENHQVPTATSNVVRGIELHEGDWTTTGSVKQWTYTVDGKEEIFKEKVHIDEERKIVTMTAVGGHCLDLYEAYKVTFHVFPNAGGTLVILTVEYEKRKEDTPTPNHYLDFMITTLKDVDKHLLEA